MPARLSRHILRAALAAALVAPLGAAAEVPTVTMTRVPGEAAVELVGDIPVTGSFVVRHRLTRAARAATLTVWPAAIRPCEGDPPPHFSRQTHVIEMAMREEGGARWASATVPHLQVGRRFCFRVQTSEGLALPADDAVGLVAARFASIATAPERWADSIADEALRRGCQAAQAAGAAGEVVDCAPDTWRAALARRILRRLVASPMVADRARLETIRSQRAANTKVMGGLLADLDRLTPLPTATGLLDAGAARAMNAEQARARREALGEDAAAQAWRSWLKRYAECSADGEDLTRMTADLEGAISASAAKLQAEIEEAVRAFLTDEAHAQRHSLPAWGRARTPDAGNYVSPIVGVALGVPYHGGDVWLVTYTGIHVFAEPVERSIAFDELVGGTGWQRFSLFLGALTSDAGPVTGARVSPALGGSYPGVGIGWRASQYVALDGMVFLYRVDSADPLSDRSTLGPTFTVGLTAELDIIKWLTPN